MNIDLSNKKVVKDIFVKLNNLFKDTCYIYKDGRCISTRERPDDNDRLGHFMTIINEKGMEYLSGLFEKSDIVLVSDLKGLKESLILDNDIKTKIKKLIKEDNETQCQMKAMNISETEYIEFAINKYKENLPEPLTFIIDELPNSTAIRKRIESMDETFKTHTDYKTISDEFLEKMFIDYDYVELPLGNDSEILISKSIFPTISNLKAAKDIIYTYYSANDEMNVTLFKWTIDSMDVRLLLYSIA